MHSMLAEAVISQLGGVLVFTVTTWLSIPADREKIFLKGKPQAFRSNNR